MADRAEYHRSYYQRVRGPKERQFYQDRGVSKSGLYRRKLKQEIAELRKQRAEQNDE